MNSENFVCKVCKEEKLRIHLKFGRTEEVCTPCYKRRGYNQMLERAAMARAIRDRKLKIMGKSL